MSDDNGRGAKAAHGAAWPGTEVPATGLRPQSPPSRTATGVGGGAVTDVGLANRVFAEAFVDELARGGVRHACIAPGSRSTPLALALAGHGAIRPWIHIDERSAAFFALGMARASGEPVAILCSSGTAAANFLPAVVEAFHARIPLVVLTADRPPELRGVGAAQTIDQLRLYGGHVRLFVEMPTPELTDDLLRGARTVAGRALAAARGGAAGPVHVNFPFREPLLPAPDATTPSPGLNLAAVSGRHEGAPYVAVSSGTTIPDPGAIAAVAADLANMPLGLIICGPESTGRVGGAGHDSRFAPAVAALAVATGYPILADPLSGMRCGPHDRSLIVDSYDAFLRDEAISRDLAPEVVIQFGAAPTSKPLTTFLGRFPSLRRIVVDHTDGWRDPTLTASDVLGGDAGAVCKALTRALVAARIAPGAGNWAREWTARGATARAAIAGQLAATDEPFEGRVFAELAELLPDGATLFAGNSMPVRDLDSFFPSSGRAIRCLANRGANGIDGVVSSALGAAAATGGPTVLVIGDLSFYHDLNGLLAAKRHGIRATIVLLNNDGGGIFSFLPQAGALAADRFEELFGTPTGLDFGAAAALYGARFSRPEHWEEFRAAVAAGIAGDGLSIVEVVTDRARNVAQHRAVWAAVSERLRAEADAPAEPLAAR